MNDREQRWTQLMLAARAGDRGAYERLLRELAPVLRDVVRRRLANFGAPTGEAEDVVQEVLLALHLKRQTWRAEDPLGPWLWTIVRNKLVDHLRRRGRRVEVPVEDLAEILPAPEERPGTEARDVERHLALLPEKQQAVLRSIAVDGSSVGDTAQRMQMTPGAVRVALHRAFASLSARLRSDQDE